MKVVKIRSYQPDDLENIVQLWYGTWHKTFPHLQHPQTYSGWKQKFYELVEDGEIFVAEVENKIVGFAVILTKEQCLSQLFIDENYQGLGIGSALIHIAKRLCPQGLNLYTLQENLKACAFYEKHGFKSRTFSINEFNGQPNVEYFWIPEPRLRRQEAEENYTGTPMTEGKKIYFLPSASCPLPLFGYLCPKIG